MRGRGALWALVAAGALLLAGCAGPGGAGKGAGPAGDETAQYLAFLRATESATPASEVRLPPAAQWPDVLARCRTGVPALLELAGELQQLEAQIASADGEPLTADANVVGPALYWAVVLSPFGHGGMTDQERDTLARRLSGLPVAGTIVLPAPAQGDLITRAATAGSRLFADGAGRLPALIERLAASPKAAQTVSGAEALLLAAAYAQSEGGGVTASAALAKAIDMDGMAACIQDLGKGGSLKPFTAPAAGKTGLMAWSLPRETTERGERVLTQRGLQYLPDVDDQSLYYELTLRKVGDGPWEFVSGTQVKDGKGKPVLRVATRPEAMPGD